MENLVEVVKGAYSGLKKDISKTIDYTKFLIDDRKKAIKCAILWSDTWKKIDGLYGWKDWKEHENSNRPSQTSEPSRKIRNAKNVAKLGLTGTYTHKDVQISPIISLSPKYYSNLSPYNQEICEGYVLVNTGPVSELSRGEKNEFKVYYDKRGRILQVDREFEIFKNVQYKPNKNGFGIRSETISKGNRKSSLDELREVFPEVFGSDVPTVFHNLFNNRNQRIDGLSQIVEDEDAERIYSKIEEDITDLQRMDYVSYNSVFDAVHKQTKKDIKIKVTGNRKKAEIECVANYFLSQHHRLKHIITPGLTLDPVELGDGFYATVQETIVGEDNEKIYDTHYYMAAFAMLHSHASGVLRENNVNVPTWKAKEFDDILVDIDQSRNPEAYRFLKTRYKENAEILNNLEPECVIHTDAKNGNRKIGKIIDLESLQYGHPAIDIALILTQQGIKTEEWGKYIESYCSVFATETGANYDIDGMKKLLDLSYKAKSVVSFKELGGLYSRKMENTQIKEANQLEDSLIEKPIEPKYNFKLVP